MIKKIKRLKNHICGCYSITAIIISTEKTDTLEYVGVSRNTVKQPYHSLCMSVILSRWLVTNCTASWSEWRRQYNIYSSLILLTIQLWEGQTQTVSHTGKDSMFFFNLQHWLIIACHLLDIVVGTFLKISLFSQLSDRKKSQIPMIRRFWISAPIISQGQ